MKNTYYNRPVYNKNMPLDNGPKSGLTRLAPAIIVLTVLAGFISLSWYAYHSGMQSGKEDDLPVIQADKTPMKEKPVDPGGMHFPNQDKTIFDTFAGNAPQPLKVERVLPAPEEPMPRDVDMSDTDSWINEKLQHHDPETSGPVRMENAMKKADAIITPAGAAMSEHTVDQITESVVTHRQVIKANTVSDSESETYVAPKLEAKAEPAKVQKVEQADIPAPAAAATPIEKPKAVSKVKAPEKPLAKETTSHALAGNGSAVQLGAYRTEKEASQAWEKIRKKYKELSDKHSLIAKADLGAKGIYYRLRVNGVSDAKSLCKALAAKSQACVVSAGK